MNALRKRVLLKSPVRKIRTPGSVRGLLGNWQSYRNAEELLRISQGPLSLVGLFFRPLPFYKTSK